MARALPQSQPADYARDENPAEWQSLRSELVALLDQVDSQVARTREPSLTERVRDLRFQVAEAAPDASGRQREALKSVQRAITRFDHDTPPMPPNPRDSLQAAINQIRSRQQERPQPAAPQPRSAEGPMLERLAYSVNGLSGRLERLEGEIRTQIKTGANVKDVADQVGQLAHVVELLAGAVGETGQVKRLEGQIASLGKIMSQGREMDVSTLTRRLDDVAATVGKLAELQVHYADRVQNPVDSDAFKDGMRSIEDSVRNVYDRIDTLERHSSLSPQDLDHVTAEMARFTEALQDSAAQPQNLVELVDALNSRISDIESGDRLLHALRNDLAALRDSVVVTLAPRFDAIEQRIETLSGSVSTREDMAEIGRQIGALGDRIGERSTDPGLGQIEAQVRQLVARMDQTGEQLSGLAKLYSSDAAVAMPDLDAMAEMVASRAAEAMQRSAPDASLTETISGLETRITAMLQSMRHDPETGDFGGMQAGISEVNERLKRLEASLMERPMGAMPSRPAPAPVDEAEARLEGQADIAAIIADADAELQAMPAREPTPMPPPRTDFMPRSPDEDAPLNAPAFPEPTGPVQSALEARNGPRKRHPGLEEELSLAARYDQKPEPPAPPPGFEPAAIAPPPAPKPSAGFSDATPEPVYEAAPESTAASNSRNTFIEAARRAAQRQTPKPEVHSNSLIGRALARFHTGEAEPKPKQAKAKEARPRALAGDKPARAEFKPEPVPAVVVPVAAPSLEPQIAGEGPAPKAAPSESFLLKHRKAILLGAAIVAIMLLTINLVAQRLNQEDAAPAATGDAATLTTGAIALPLDPTPTADLAATPAPPRVIPMVDTLSTGSIDSSTALGFTTSPSQEMPSAFEAAADLVSTGDTGIAPLVPATSPVKVELPPEGVGPMDLREAAASGDPRAQFEVAAIFTEGRAVPQDYKAAATWYERAAAQGFAPAQYRLGSLYENGNGVAKDLDAARLWYERAAEAGNRMSMHNLAALYAGGQLGKQQFDSAAKWFEEAASRGLTDSQFNLGMLYARGLGVPQSLADSYKWFGLAALSGDKDAAKARDDVARSLDAETVSRLVAEVAAFKPSPIDLPANFAPIGTWSRTLDPGETIGARDIVASVQKALGKLGYDVGTSDGIAGKKTSDAIKAFELATGMNEVGLINPRLLAVLGSQPV
ncbi:MAG: SEL1-like repeat protein [Devosia nanyangense]|uniref:SEL1-like repeat protein n=1 Tax=Devosia nanyangense TaxID=1228055 RepID=A0A933L361_9HYPH|nr:SEL1-like repeat protein [Devosia nanyangense]